MNILTSLQSRVCSLNQTHIIISRALSTSQLKEYYAILNVHKSSTPKEIKESFLKLSKIYHPDNRVTGSHLKFVKLKEAYDALKNGIPTTTTSSYSNYSDYNEWSDLSHRAYRRSAEYGTNYERQQGRTYGFGGPYANSSRPWEDLKRDREYARRAHDAIFHRRLRPVISMTMVLSAMAWIVIYSSLLLFWDYKDGVRRAIRLHQQQNYEEFMAYKRQRKAKLDNQLKSASAEKPNEPPHQTKVASEHTDETSETINDEFVHHAH